MIANINWLVFYSGIALGALLTALLALAVATGRRPAGHVPSAGSGERDLGHESSRTAKERHVVTL